MSYHKEILEKLSIRTISYFKDDLSMPYDIDINFKIEEVDKVDYLTDIAFISFSGDLNGTSGMSISRQLAFDIAKAFVYGEMEDDEIEELSRESVKEVLNVVIGNIISDLEIVQKGGKVDISVPLNIPGPTTINKKENGKMFVSKLKYNDTSVILSYFT